MTPTKEEIRSMTQDERLAEGRNLISRMRQIVRRMEAEGSSPELDAEFEMLIKQGDLIHDCCQEWLDRINAMLDESIVRKENSIWTKVKKLFAKRCRPMSSC